ncbi:hypothetical protein [Microvirga aerophila]|uniref:Uncharacterized protein n=1 Tax=Microvirga aerophila TaxID=670291 RepID=A0A512C4C5_9HYPH|nr:hypothetical protein [Microvirga aerophila]GEO19054.1 hypothetical protein MAE02_67500 [Microvirga aerophila]
MDDIISQTEQTHRTLQEAIESAKEVIEQTLDLIERTQAIRGQPDIGSSANMPSAEPIKRISRKSVTS